MHQQKSYKPDREELNLVHPVPRGPLVGAGLFPGSADCAELALTLEAVGRHHSKESLTECGGDTGRVGTSCDFGRPCCFWVRLSVEAFWSFKNLAWR